MIRASEEGDKAESRYSFVSKSVGVGSADGGCESCEKAECAASMSSNLSTSPIDIADIKSSSSLA